MKFILVFVYCLFFVGCPLQEDCDAVMQCEDEVEMFCDKNDSGCGENCHYYVYKHCYEVCK